MERQKVIERAVQKLFNSLEEEYKEARQDELGILHNKMVDALTEVGASPQNTLLVLELLKQEVLQDCIGKFLGKATEPGEKVRLSEKPPTTIAGSKSGGGVS